MALREEIASALWGNESGGDTAAYNASGQAKGKYQFQQPTWDGAAEMVGRADLVGVDPRDVAAEDQDEVALGYVDHLLQKGGGDPGYVFAAWYEGEDTALSHQQQGNYPTAAESYEGDDATYPSVQQYVDNGLKSMGLPTQNSYDPIQGLAYNTNPVVDYQAIENAKTGSADNFITRTANIFADSFYDSPLGGGLRDTWLHNVYGNTERVAAPFTVQQADLDLVKAKLPGDLVAQQYVLLNAESKEHLQALLYQKEQDAQRRAKVQAYGLGLHSVGALAGAVLGDPTNLLPLGQSAVAVKALARFGRLGQYLSTAKVAKYAEIAATNAMLNVATAKVAERTGGFTQDYEAAAAVGAFAGGTLSAVGDMLRYGMGKVGQKVAAKLDDIEDKAVRKVMDMDVSPGGKIRDILRPLNDIEFPKVTNSKYLKGLMDNDSIFVVTKADVSKIGASIGRNIPDTAKAFYDPVEKVAVLIKNNIVAGDNIDNLLAHEVGVHANLASFMGEEAYDGLMRTVRKNISKPPDKAWEDAVRATPGGGAEEVLGAWVEKAGVKDKAFKKAKSGILTMMRNAGLDVNLSDEEIKRMIKGSMENVAKHGIEELPDGSVVMGGLKYSNLNILNPHVYSNLYDLETQDITQKAFPKVFRKFTRDLENGWFFGNNHGIGRNSMSKTLRQFATSATTDPRLRGFEGEGVLPMDKIKEDIQQVLNARMQPWYDCRNRFVYGTEDVEGLKGLAVLPKTATASSKMLDFNKQFVQAYNYKYGGIKAGVKRTDWSADVMEAVEHYKSYQDLVEDIGLHSSERYGSTKSNLLSESFGNRREFHRVTDDGSLSDFIRKFPTADDAKKWLQEYGYRIANKDAHLETLNKLKKEKYSELVTAHKEKLAAWEGKYAEYEKALTKWDEDMKAWKAAKETNPKAPKPRKPQKVGEPPAAPAAPKIIDKVADLEGAEKAEFEEYVRKEANAWGLGQVDKNKSNIAYLKGEVKEDGLPFLRERFVGDTSTEVPLPSGEVFSFDNNLRSYDVDFIHDRVLNRFSGECAVKTRYDNVTDGLSTELANVEKELGNALKMQDVTESQMRKEIAVYKDTIANLRGYRGRDDVKGKWDAMTGIIRNIVYANRSGNFGANQISESGGSFGYMGLRAALYSSPDLSDMYRAAKTGRLQAALVKEVRSYVFGEEMASKIWSKNDVTYRAFRDASKRGDIGREAVDKVGTGVNYLGKVASSFNGLQRLTQNQVDGIRADSIADSLEWAFGKKFSDIRNPFSTKKLQAAGISEDFAKKIQADIQQYAVKGEDGHFKSFDVDTWRSESPDAFFKWKFMLDNQVDRCLTQNTAGNRNWLKDSSWRTRAFFQFKDFSLKAVNAQTLRALSSRELDDAVAAVGSMATNAGVYIALTNARAYAYWPDNEVKRQQYLDKRLSYGEVATAALLRGAITGSFLSFGRDGYEAFTGSQSYRTTVDRTGSFGQEKTPLEVLENFDAGDTIGNVAGQLPVVSTVANAGLSAFDFAHAAVSDTRSVTKKDLKTLYKSLPLNSFLPLVYLNNAVVDDTSLPEKEPKKRK